MKWTVYLIGVVALLAAVGCEEEQTHHHHDSGAMGPEYYHYEGGQWQDRHADPWDHGDYPPHYREY